MFPPTTLAIDFGTKRIGLAISRGSLAEPLIIIHHNDDTLYAIKKLIDQEKIENIIVGISENVMAEMTKQFVAELRTMTTLPIEFVDETLSSHTVHAKTLAAHRKQSLRQQPIDHLAAAEFLQEWLDTQS